MCAVHSQWGSGDAYEPYVGRWSRLVAREFVSWLDAPVDLKWLDVGCGTGALTQTVLDLAKPAHVHGIDASREYVEHARAHIADPQAIFETGNAMRLPYQSEMFDVAVSGLAINFVPDPAAAIGEIARVLRAHGVAGLYVWDYAGEMQLMRYFWDAAAALNPAAAELDEGPRFPICQPQPLAQHFHDAGLRDVETRAIDVPTVFNNFDDYWQPFLGAQGPAPSYAMGLDEPRRNQLRDLIRSRLPFNPDGSIPLRARAWAVKGRK